MSGRAGIDEIVEAVLYEGFILYPYRPSAKKNRQRFTFGLVYPQVYSEAEKGRERYLVQTECLVTNKDQAEIDVSVRFLHPVKREIGVLVDPLAYTTDAPLEELPIEFVPELRIEDKLYQAWHEAIERRVQMPTLTLKRMQTGASVQFAFPSLVTTEPIRNSSGDVKALLVRRQQEIEGKIEIQAQPLDSELAKVTVRVLNQTLLSAQEFKPETVLLRTMASTHTLLHTTGAEFLSLLDPPPARKSDAAGCVNLGTWPVLVGEEAVGRNDTILSSPIILYDYPQIAPESPGSFFDGTEVDELLALRIQTLTDEEKCEMRQAGEQARRLLERTESLSQAELLSLHGARRETSLSAEELFGTAGKLAAINVRGTYIKPGDRVRLKPKNRADVMDLAMDGKTAVVESLEQDVEDRVHIAVILENDPGKDLGLMRQPGHRFFYDPEEIEPLAPGETTPSVGTGGWS